MVWECLLRKICVIFSGRQDVNNTEHVAIINLLQGWEMLSDNDMCSFPGSQESWHGDICQHAAHSDHSLHWLLFVHQRRVKWKMFDSFLSVARVILPSNSLSLLSWGQSLIECVQTESDGSDHLEWHSPPMMGWPGSGPHNTWWAHRDNYPAANTFFTLWHLQSSPDFLHQLSYIPCNVCYKIREKEMWPDKVKTITSVMKPLLGRGDNERIFSRTLVSINHVDHHCEPAHCSDVLPDSIDSFFTRLVSQDSLSSLQ